MDREFHYFFLFFQIRTQVYTYATHLRRTFGIRRSTVSLEIIRPPRPIRASGYPGIRRRILKSSFPSNPFPEPAMQTALLLDTINGSVRRTDRVSTLTKQMLREIRAPRSRSGVRVNFHVHVPRKAPRN